MVADWRLGAAEVGPLPRCAAWFSAGASAMTAAMTTAAMRASRAAPAATHRPDDRRRWRMAGIAAGIASVGIGRVVWLGITVVGTAASTASESGCEWVSRSSTSWADWGRFCGDLLSS